MLLVEIRPKRKRKAVNYFSQRRNRIVRVSFEPTPNRSPLPSIIALLTT